MATRKQELARARNWNKARLMGALHLDLDGLIQSEREALKELKEMRDTILSHWDSNTVIFRGKPFKYPHKCYFCSRRSKTKYVLDWTGPGVITACKRHYNIFKGDAEEAEEARTEELAQKLDDIKHDESSTS